MKTVQLTTTVLSYVDVYLGDLMEHIQIHTPRRILLLCGSNACVAVAINSTTTSVVCRLVVSNAWNTLISKQIQEKGNISVLLDGETVLFEKNNNK